MPGFCCVPFCTNEGGFVFPKTGEIRKKWIIAVRRKDWTPNASSVVCGSHFEDNDFEGGTTNRGTSRTRRRLKKDVVPSIFRWTEKAKEKAQSRNTRKRKREERSSVAAGQEEQHYVLFDEMSIAENVAICCAQDVPTPDTCISDSAPVAADSAPVAADSAPVAADSAPVAADSAPVSDSAQISFLNNRQRTIVIDDDDSDTVSDTSSTATTSTYSTPVMNSVSTGKDVHVLFDDDNNILEDDVGAPSSQRSKTKRYPPRIALSTSNAEETANGLIVNHDLFLQPYICVERLQTSDTLVRRYTGLETFEKFMLVFWSLGPNVNHLTYCYTKTVSVPPLTCFLMMTVYLRCRFAVCEMARMFSVSAHTVTNVCYTWIKFCALQWQEIDIWPKVEVVRYHCPEDFKRKFPDTRVIIDGTEIPIEKPSNPSAQRTTFSTYKHRNTIKVLVGITPGGLVSFITPAYGGSASDRQIVERSDLLNLVEPGDVVMADKGFNVQDIFANKDVKINMPTFFKKKNRMTPSSVAKDRLISSKRVHVERIIGGAKSYKILNGPLNSTETALASEIVYVCFMLTNFRKNVVSKFA